ncbi:hypothetical protein CIB54_17415 [Pseudomonas fluorescens]|uniref:Uncharacterized protein n=1 Tax=Pseudomonas fluorescens TaxID=294 RepID=A0A2N1E309_PSEFL|nr:hypothetical protein CIB54_17415 [Pseudomonas fluorescens]
MPKSYEKGQWGIYKDRVSTTVIGLLVDGKGKEIRFGERPYEVRDGVLFCPEGKRLGTLAALQDSWVVNYGDHDIGHVLRALP